MSIPSANFFIFLFHAMAAAFSDSVLMDYCGKDMQIFGSDYFIPKNDHCIRRTFPHNGIAYIEWSGNILPINYPDPFCRGFSAEPNYEQALEFLTSYASSFDNDNWVPPEAELDWENFFIKLNASINLENLRRHHKALLKNITSLVICRLLSLCL